MSAALIAEAIAAVERIATGLFVWLLVGAFVATFVTLSVLTALWSLPKEAWRALTGALAASRAVRALGEQPDRYRAQHRPMWAAA